MRVSSLRHVIGNPVTLTRFKHSISAPLRLRGENFMSDVPFFPLGGFTPIQSTGLTDVATRLGATPMQVALAWLLRRAPNVLPIPGTSSLGHLRENLAAAELELPNDAIVALERIGTTRAPA